MPNLTTTDFHLKNVLHLQADILNANSNMNNYFYFFVGDYLPQANVTLQPIFDITSNTEVQLWTNMLFGKQISANNVYPMINNVQWMANTVYARYDDIDPNLPQEQFFVITTEGSNYNVWKVLDNNFGSASTVMPSIAFAVNTPYYQTSDGYRWFYMTSVPTYIGNLFQTSQYFPLLANTAVAKAAVPGALDIFSLTGNGAFYNNYIQGSFSASDITIGGSGYNYNISNNQASQVNGYYTGCLLYLSGGAGQGQWATIVNYTSNSVGNIMTLSQPFNPQPVNGTTWQISPQLNIISDGLQSVNAVARCLVNALASNGIYQIDTLQAGVGYVTVNAISVSANIVVGVTNTAIVRSINSPQHGHGSNCFSELYCNSLGISVTLANNEQNSILTTNQYQQIGLMKNPRFANVTVNISPNFGNFLLGETVYTYTANQMASNATLVVGQANITCNNANFSTQVGPNSAILLSNGSVNMLTTINTVINSTCVNVNSLGLFSCTQVQLYYVTLTGVGVVTTPGGSSITITNATPTFLSGASVIGNTSGAQGSVSTVSRNGVNEFFPTFVQLYKYSATMLNGTFENSEEVTQGNNSANIFTANGNSGSVLLYLSNFVGGLFSNGTVIGVSSGASANITGSYVPDLVYGSGDVLYIENISPVTRANTQSETFQLILNM